MYDFQLTKYLPSSNSVLGTVYAGSIFMGHPAVGEMRQANTIKLTS